MAIKEARIRIRETSIRYLAGVGVEAAEVVDISSTDKAELTGKTSPATPRIVRAVGCVYPLHTRGIRIGAIETLAVHAAPTRAAIASVLADVIRVRPTSGPPAVTLDTPPPGLAARLITLVHGLNISATLTPVTELALRTIAVTAARWNRCGIRLRRTNTWLNQGNEHH